MNNSPRLDPVRWGRTLLLGAWALAAAALGGCASAPPPPPSQQTTVVIVRPPKPHPYAVWVQGHYMYRHGRYEWVPGHWSRR